MPWRSTLRWTALSALILGAVEPAHAEGTVAAPAPMSTPVRASLRLDPPSQGCVARARLAAEVQQALGRQVFESESPDVAVEVTVDSGTRPAADIRLTNTEDNASLGHRQLKADNCVDLQGSVALALSLMLDFNVAQIPELREREQARQSASDASASPQPERQTESVDKPAETKPAETEPAKANETEPEPKTPPRSPTPTSTNEALDIDWSVLLEGRGAWGYAPKTSFGGSLALGASFPSDLYLELGVGGFPTTSFERLGASVDVSRLDVQLMLCPVTAQPGSLRLRACARAVAEQVNASGSDFAENQSNSTWSAQAGVAGTLAVRLEPLFVRARVNGGLALRRARFVATDQGELIQVYEMSPVVAEAALGLGVEF